MGRSRITVATTLLVVLAACGGSGGSRSARSTTTSGPRSTTTSTTTTRPPAPEGWTQTATAPTALGLYAVWTGSEYLGGPAGCCDDLGGTEVVAYTPASNAWRTLAPWPLAQRSGQLAAWTGTEMVVAGGREAASATDRTADHAVPTLTTAAYDPAKNTWRTLAPLPSAMTSPTSATWTGGRVVILDATQTFRYDPRTNAWTTGAPPPFRRRGSVVVSAGRQVLVWGGQDTAVPGQAESTRVVVHADGAAYDVARDRWSTIPDAPVPARTNSEGVWTGRQMIVWGGQSGGDTSAPGPLPLLGKGAAYDPTSRGWHALPPSPLKARSGQDMVWTGREVLVWGGYIPRQTANPTDDFARDGAAYDPATDTWRTMAPAPPSPPAPLAAFSAFWTGDRAVFMGGSDVNAQGIGPLGLDYAPGR